jgi:hypothetical protein
LAKNKKPEAHEFEPGQAFEQELDPHGRQRLDRPLTPAEAAEQDAANRERYLNERRKRFAPPGL